MRLSHRDCRTGETNKRAANFRGSALSPDLRRGLAPPADSKRVTLEDVDGIDHISGHHVIVPANAIHLHGKPDADVQGLQLTRYMNHGRATPTLPVKDNARLQLRSSLAVDVYRTINQSQRKLTAMVFNPNPKNETAS
jgi:hypothetical protein